MRSRSARAWTATPRPSRGSWCRIGRTPQGPHSQARLRSATTSRMPARSDHCPRSRDGSTYSWRSPMARAQRPARSSRAASSRCMGRSGRSRAACSSGTTVSRARPSPSSATTCGAPHSAATQTRSAAYSGSTASRFASSASRRRSAARPSTISFGCPTRCASHSTSGLTTPNRLRRFGCS